MRQMTRLHPITGVFNYFEIGYVPTLIDGQPGSIQIERAIGHEWHIPSTALGSKVYATERGAIYAAIRYRAFKVAS